MRVRFDIILILFFQMLFNQGCFWNDKIQGEIIEPVPNTTVSRTLRCTGKVTGNLDGYSLWLVVEERNELGQHLYWPKKSTLGGDTQGRWSVIIFEDGPGSEITLSLMAVQERGQKVIKDWLEEASKTGNFAPLTEIPGSIILDKVENLVIE